MTTLNLSVIQKYSMGMCFEELSSRKRGTAKLPKDFLVEVFNYSQEHGTKATARHFNIAEGNVSTYRYLARKRRYV